MSAEVVAAGVGAGLNLTGGLFSNRTNRLIAKENMALQREANQQNIALTREINNQNIAFQQQENDITRQREDNAIQRAAADMTAAGLSKTLAAGNPASASALSAPQASTPQVSPVQNSFKYESALQKMDIARFMQSIVEKDAEIKNQKAMTDAQVDLIKSQIINQNLQNSVFMENFHNEQLLKYSSIALNNAKEEQSKAETNLTKIVGEYKAQEIQSDINVKVQQALYYKAQTAYTEKGREKLAVEIAHIICQSNKLNKETELVVQDIVYRKLQIDSLNTDLGYAKEHGLPVGKLPGGMFGTGLTTLETIANMFGKGKITNPLFTFQAPEETYYDGMEIPQEVFNIVDDMYNGKGNRAW